MVLPAPPAVVIVARHGARLDASDKQWHLTSPTPYDPPLTYGGWTQSRALGARIASILEARELLHDDAQISYGVQNGAQTTAYRNRKKRRKHRIMIHTSPFLRCVQTSIAIGAGISQYQGSVQGGNPSGHQETTSGKSHHMHSGSPYLHARDHGGDTILSAISEPEEENVDTVVAEHHLPQKQLSKNARLRVDGFLGEWMSPDYFDNIVPPPSSVMMVAGAKADLLRRGTEINNTQLDTPLSARGNFPGGWGSRLSSHRAGGLNDADGPLSDLTSLTQVLPLPIGPIGISNIDSSANGSAGSYIPPTPSYAISPSEPIPPGFVAHARDACVNVDYQWDSIRQPQLWGSGGEYGEEWSSMHKRFRRGLVNMIDWYRNRESSNSDKKDQTEDDVDTVLVVVTHGAGCNALIGALTNQPVLLDVGMASLTLAVRKENIGDRSPPGSPISPWRRSEIDQCVSELYDVRLIASTEHLRKGSSKNPLAVIQQSPIPTLRDPSPHVTLYRNKYSSRTSTGSSDGKPIENGRALANVITGGGHQRSASMGTSPTGLWSPPNESKTQTNELAKEDVPYVDGVSNPAGVQHFMNGDLEKRKGEWSTTTSKSQVEDTQKSLTKHGSSTNGPTNGKPGAENEALNDSTSPLGSKLGGRQGLWGIEKEKGPKRRWTVTDRH